MVCRGAQGPTATLPVMASVDSDSGSSASSTSSASASVSVAKITFSECESALRAAQPLPSTNSMRRMLQEKRSVSERKLFTPTADKLVLVMVGLPARGKSFIAKKLAKFVCWKGMKGRVFNVGQVRRSKCAGVQDHTFFDPNNTKAKEEREELARISLEQVQQWFLGDGTSKGGEVAVFDATNTTRSRRQVLLDTFSAFAKAHKMSVHVVFVESICTNESVINMNIAQKVASSPDYAHMSAEEAMNDLKQRMKNYEAAYEALQDEEQISYIKLFDLQSKVHAKGMYVSLSLCEDGDGMLLMWMHR